MTLITTILILFVAILHIFFMILEMFLWDKPAGLRAFGQTREQAAASKTLAANQGLYNGFLAAGLLWGLYLGDAGFDFKLFFLLCVVIAGLYGGLTVNKKILYIQALPALIALIFLIVV